ncbi:MAG: hypothetical protein ACKVQT_18045 [Burkholderiales bacterium]
MKGIGILGGIALVALAATVGAKLPTPPLTDEQKSKAEQTKAKAAHTGQVEAFQLCSSMDKVAARYAATMKAKGKEFKPMETKPCADPGPFQAATR